ncbi:MAG TPA: DUF5777 family beta-barrel protein [Chitinophagaceae bacterium]|nr:DUF5777 family beta-barrel protein [Chitinophagaceae bacterium]
MKTRKFWITALARPAACLGFLLLAGGGIRVLAQDADSTASEPAETTPARKAKPVKNTFESIWLIDNQTVMVPRKKSFEMDIMHRFGTLKTGYQDFFGFFAPSNIRLGFSYVPIDRLLVGTAITKANMTWEGYAKYALLRQTPGRYPVSITYLVDMAVDTRTKDNFIHSTDRLMYFHQLMIARKITPKLSIQVAPSLSHQNVVNGYYKTSGTVGDSSYKATVEGEMKHEHFALAISARYKLKPTMSVLFGYDQPLTRHAAGNPNPNLSIGVEFTTSSHTFQLFFTNYYYITPQRNNLFNKNNPVTLTSFNDMTLHKENFLIGFNITRLWNY